ncbi:ABC transporter substrate-binding protein [Roseovarius salinarum]|uniref:ABC transporter substrate-binding protein n=1 Tax=Roseovarius salinarum TaxID=1981892 RepID=UPI0018E499D0|nr:ABC transporter substrate-binding protein [Roseovarius salinarum]
MRFSSQVIYRAAGILVALALALPGAGRADEPPLTVVSWGGSYEAAQRKAIFTPFTEATGIAVEVKRYDGGIAELRDRAAAEGWDVIDMLEADAISGCEAGLLAPLDPQALFGDDAARLAGDMAPAVIRRCSLPQNVYATVMAYDDRAFPGVKPTRIEDFFDVARFPGKRAIRRSPDGILEWALLAEGVPPSQVYDLLSTDRGLRLAFRRLDSLRGHIIWWEDAATPPRLLEEGKAVMASGYNGRFFTAARRDGAPISVVWDGRLIAHDVWAISATADRPEAARRFLRFAVRPGPMARLAERIPYGPARRSALSRIGLGPETGIPMRDHLPNAPQHGPRKLVRDSDWASHTRAMRQRRFEAWLEKGGDGG